MPTWPSVIVTAAAIGVVLGAAQQDEPITGVAGSETDQPRESADVDPARPSEARWPVGVYESLPAATAFQIALTFDDGPDPRWTPQVLDVLARHDAVATFCVIGEQVAGNEDLVRRVISEGHALCNHSMTHDYGLAAEDAETVSGEIATVTGLLEQAAPQVDVTAFRAPGGRFGPVVVDQARAQGLDSWAWSVDARDWDGRGADSIVTTVLDGVAPGAVVLLHDGGGDRSATVAAIDEVLPVLASVGYSFVTLPDMP